MSMLARGSLWFGLITIFTSSVAYLVLCYRENNPIIKKIARTSFFSFAAFISLASFFLMYFFLTHNFRYEYVISYSSTDLPLLYLISSFWAGQEGSFLLWVFIGAWLGGILIYKAGAAEPQIMSLYNLQLIFLTILLIKQSPFKTVPIPYTEGIGLNMLLQDFWMVIHPPIVFLGYAAYTIPFAYAMASLWQREYKDWVKQALPWTSYAFVSLGAGIIIGGVWSYKVLGWGGYWGWDPVENASLLPWLTGTAMLHGLLLQRSTGRLAKTNYFLAALSFVLIIYSTFLTRSGILATFSVHSFQDLGITGWLVFFMFAFICITAYFIISRANDIQHLKKVKNDEISFFSLEFGLIAAVILLSLSAILTGVGTSAPLITRILEKTSKVTNDFYVTVNLPIAILIALFLSYVPVLKLGKNEPPKVIPKLITGLISASLSAVVALIAGFAGIAEFLLVIFAGFTIGVNLELLVRLIRKSFSATAAALAHLGLGLMFIGFVASTVYDVSERTVLPKGQAVSVLDYEIKFVEANLAEEKLGTRLYLPLEIKKGHHVIYGNPDIYVEHSETGDGKRFHHPFIMRGLWTDLYISPESYESGGEQDTSARSLVIKKGDSVKFQDYVISFEKFDISGMEKNQQQGTMKVGADLFISFKSEEPVLLKPWYAVEGRKSTENRVKLPGNIDAYLVLLKIDATNKAIELYYEGPLVEKLYAEVSIKPGMSILWLGVILLLLGGTISIYRRQPHLVKDGK